MARAFRLNSTRAMCAGAAILLGIATAAAGQQADDQNAPSPINSSESLHLPQNPEVFGAAMPPVIKATAIVNGDVITQTDVDQRLALLAIANNADSIPANQIDELRQQVLRSLIDETLEIQAAKDDRNDKIVVKKSEIDRAVEQLAARNKQTPEQMAAFLEAHGSSMNSMRHQIEGEIAWQKLQSAKIENDVSVGDEEVKAVLDKLQASKGTEEYRVGEIFLPASSATQEQTLQNASKILDQLKNGASFSDYARQYSQASTAAVGGDLGWVRPEQLPAPIAAALREMGPGTISSPIPVPGGVSIIAVQDTRKILTKDPRDALLSLKQVSISFPKGTTREQAEPVLERFADAAKNIGGCGGAEKLGAEFHGEVVQSDQVKMRDLPVALQQLMLPMQVGQATQPFGSIEDSVRVLVMCGRDEVDPTAPTYDDIYSQLNKERVTTRANRYLADLRRDAVIEFR